MTFKQKIQNLIFPLGSVQTIKMGYLKGFKIRLSKNSLWSPLIGNWEPAMQRIMKAVVKPGHVAYDVGANNGLHGLLLSTIVGDKGHVFNFEPLPSNIEEITENFQLNNLRNYTNVCAAVSDSDGIIRFELGDHDKQGHIAGAAANGKGIDVKTISLDSFIEKGNPAPDFIKMDIEGAEGAALQGFERNIGKKHPLMIIELHGIQQDLMVGKFLKKYNYTAYRFDPFKKLHFTKITDLEKPHPHPDGVWGSIFCVGPDKSFENYQF
ncbi:MAG TPA: FkbM family methyltransferase [Chitinophagaceae bacterium]|nr:FkbM family methyltransferase [Chitinophagaceae bacterium]